MSDPITIPTAPLPLLPVATVLASPLMSPSLLIAFLLSALFAPISLR